MEHVDLLVIGGGAAGMAAAVSASKTGRRVMLCEKDERLGGILNQCVHNGFGRSVLGKDCTGVEYAAEYAARVKASDISVRTGTTVLSLSPDRTAVLSGRDALLRISFERCLLSTGCRERTPWSLPIAGTRPAGVFTAGTAQRLENVDGLKVGSRIVILGSGDVGQIMARQFAQTGREVVAVVEQMDHVGGLARNRKECLEDYHIPVLLRSTVDEILGAGRVSGVMVRDLDTGKRRELSCDTLVTALGLIPEQTLCRNVLTDGELPGWLRFCGNCECVHDIVDSVTREAEILGAELW